MSEAAKFEPAEKAALSTHPAGSELDALLLPLLPTSLRSDRQDWLLREIAPHFVRSFSMIGDVCVFGCLPQLLPIPLAFAVKALAMPKMTYAFDLFDARDVSDWTGRTLSGAEVYADILRWSAAIPIRPVQGDPAETATMLFDRISFIWFDLPSPKSIEAVLKGVWSLLGTNTSIGIGQSHAAAEDLEGWAESMVAANKLVRLTRARPGVIGFYRPGAG